MIALFKDLEIQCFCLHGFGLFPPKFLSSLQDLVSLWLTYQASDGLKVCSTCSIGQSNPVRRWGHFSGVWPLGTFIELGMALNILSSPSLGNGIGSDFQNKWKCICMLTLFHYRWKWISQKIVPDILQRRNFVPDQCCCNKPNCCYCYVEYIVKTMSHSLWTQHCMQYACMTAGPRTTAATVWQRSSSALRPIATALRVCCTLEKGLVAEAKGLFWWKLLTFKNIVASRLPMFSLTQQFHHWSSVKQNYPWRQPKLSGVRSSKGASEASKSVQSSLLK